MDEQLRLAQRNNPERVDLELARMAALPYGPKQLGDVKCGNKDCKNPLWVSSCSLCWVCRQSSHQILTGANAYYHSNSGRLVTTTIDREYTTGRQRAGSYDCKCSPRILDRYLNFGIYWRR